MSDASRHSCPRGTDRWRAASRSIIYRANLGGFRERAVFLVKDCCGGRPDSVRPLIADSRPLLSPPTGGCSWLSESSMFCSSAPATAPARSSRKRILRKEARPRFHAYSAGSHPKGAVNPFALKVLESLDYPTEGLRSKSWDEFAAPALRSWISSLRSAIRPPAKRARCGRASR